MKAIFLGRQPILDSAQKTVGYELLFRSGTRNGYDDAVDGDTATATVLTNTILELGLDNIVGSGLAFVNLTDRFLESPEMIECLPPQRVVLEVLETVTPTSAVLEGINHLREQEYTIALDDYVANDQTRVLIEHADIVKYDITQHCLDELPEQIRRDKAANRKVLAERVETVEEFDRLRSMGFDYYQGFFFARPTMISGASIPSNRLALMQLLALMNRPDVSFEKLAEATTREIALSVRALRFVNSPITGLSGKVTSIKQALILLGRDTIRNWVTLLVMSGVEDKPGELISMALVRARFCQLAAQREQRSDDADYFTIGLLSLLDVVMGSDMQTVLDSVAAPQAFVPILLKEEGHAGGLLKAARYLERSHGGDDYPADIDITPTMVELFQEALLWAEDTKRNIPD